MTSTKEEVNILLRETAPARKAEQFYDFEKCKKTAFSKITGPQTHLLRRQLILKKYPDVAKLMYRSSNISYYLSIAIVLTQLTLAYFLKDMAWTPFLLITYIVGGTLGHMSHVLVHDFVHFAGEDSTTVSRFFAILNNCAIGIPSAISFGKYHADHHNFLNEYGKDPDLPLVIQAQYVNTKVRKALFLFFITLVYALRPVFFYNRPVNKYELINYITILIYNVLLYKLVGPGALCYVLLCGFLSIGPHPTAFHILAEHFEYVTKMETYDYLGKFNIVNLNIGYHIEHHDFPSIPWYNLPALRARAPEFYEQFPLHTNYFEVAYKFVMDDNFTLWNRILRTEKS